MEEQFFLIFWLLVLSFIAFFGGWFMCIAVEQYRADTEREEQAEKRRQEYSEEYIKQINRSELLDSWIAEAKGGAEK